VSVLEFLDWEEQQELRWEFDGFEPVTMTGGTDAHETLGGTLRALLYNRLRGGPCRVRGPTLKVEVAGRIRYPDAFVSCTPVHARRHRHQGPVVVFEVLSPGTSRIDRIDKLREYRATPSIQHYVILEPDSIAATVYTRRGVDWIVTPLIAGDTLEMLEIGVTIPPADIYADVDLDPPASGETVPA
jgi:Uma2 family endonuclease